MWPSSWWTRPLRGVVDETSPQARRKVDDQTVGGSSESLKVEAVAQDEATAEEKEEQEETERSCPSEDGGRGGCGPDGTSRSMCGGSRGKAGCGGSAIAGAGWKRGRTGRGTWACKGMKVSARNGKMPWVRRKRRRRVPDGGGGSLRKEAAHVANRDKRRPKAGGVDVHPIGRALHGRGSCAARTRGGGRLQWLRLPGVVARGELDAQSSRARGEFTPTDFRSVALIEDETGGRVERVPLYLDEPLVFRLGGDWQGEGRKVRGVGVGHFIVIAPAGWTRSGDAPVDVEPCVDAGYRAHYFFGSRGDGRRIEGFEEGSVSSSVIVLDGDRVFDDSDQGELFVGDPPVLEAPGMAVARVGEEGKGGWGETFGLDDGKSLADVLAGREGWFFVRVYREDAGVETDSVHFRYMADLREIRMDGETYTPNTVLLPRSRGHVTTDVEIVRDPRTVAVAGVTTVSSLELESDGGRVACPADREAEELQIRLTGEHGGVDVVVGVPRVWWRLSVPGEAPGQWLDQALRMTREEFRTLGLAGAEICIDVPDRVRRVGVGFGDDGATNYRATKSGRRRGCLVPLRHFVDHEEIDRRLFVDAALRARFPDAAVGLLEIGADAMPRIVEFSVGCGRVSQGDTVVVRWRAEDCEGVTVSLGPDVGQVSPEGGQEIQVEQRTKVTLTLSAGGMADIVEERVIEVAELGSPNGRGPVARARALEGWRPAKGFSLREVSAVRGAAELSIPVDRRRRSEHAVNVASLERCVNEQQ